jgi:hypothetical protein
MSSAAENTSASQSSASETVVVSQRPTKTPHDHPRSSLEQPRQRRRLDPEDDETVVATPAATGSGSGSGSGSSSQARAELFKDNRHGGDDMGSEYTASSSTEEDDEDNNTPVPSKRSRGSARLRMKAVRDSCEMFKPFTTSSGWSDAFSEKLRRLALARSGRFRRALWRSAGKNPRSLGA